jgi:septum formation protein
MFSLKHPLILASKSPRRSDLLRQMGFDFEVQSIDTDEHYPDNLSPDKVAFYIAEQKNKAFPPSDAIILCADTVVAVDGKILGKPQNEAEAIAMLSSLSAKKHDVYTGVCLRHKNELYSFVEKTEVYCREISPVEIQYYIEQYKPFDKAGSYGIQDWFGLTLIEKINGSYFNVMGLPTQQLFQLLKRFSV